MARPDVARQVTGSRKPKLVVAAALIGLAILIALAQTNLNAIQTGCPVGALLGAALQEIPCALIQAGLQGLQACLFDHQAFLQDFQRMLVSFWLLLAFTVGTVLTRASITAKSEVSPAPSQDFWKTGIGDVDPVEYRSTRNQSQDSAGADSAS